MDKIDIKRLSDEEECQTATEFRIKNDIVTNSAMEMIMKINELVEEVNKLNRRKERRWRLVN